MGAHMLLLSPSRLRSPTECLVEADGARFLAKRFTLGGRYLLFAEGSLSEVGLASGSLRRSLGERLLLGRLCGIVDRSLMRELHTGHSGIGFGRGNACRSV